MFHWTKIKICIAFTVTNLLLLGSPALAQDLILHIRDLGIRQKWTEFKQTQNPDRLNNFLDLPQDERIILPMPEDHDLKTKSQQELIQAMTADLIRQVDQALANSVNLTELEIQLVQNINAKGYFSPERQGLVKQFGDIAYQAIGRLHQHLEANNVKHQYAMTLGSNGTHAFAENVDSWSPYRDAILQVSFIDGRASIPATIETIQALGANKFRIETIRKDHADDAYSVSNLNAVKRHLITRYPDLTVFYLESVTSTRSSDHVAAMAHRGEIFKVTQIKALRTFGISPDPLDLPIKLLDKVPVFGSLLRNIHRTLPTTFVADAIQVDLLSNFSKVQLGTWRAESINPIRPYTRPHPLNNFQPIVLPHRNTPQKISPPIVTGITPTPIPPSSLNGVSMEMTPREGTDPSKGDEVSQEDILKDRASDDDLSWEVE